MSKFQLYINEQRVELYNDESVSLTQTIQDVRDISKVFTDFSKPFTLPASKENNKIFKHYYRFNILSGFSFDARKKINARIELNYVPFQVGKLRLEGVDLENGKPKSYRVTFFGNTVNLKDALGEDEITSLNWLNNFNTIYSAAQVSTVLQSATGFSKTVDSIAYSAALIVPLISNTVRLWYNDDAGATQTPYTNSDGTPNIDNGGNLYHSGGASSSSPTYAVSDIHGVYYEDLTYAVKVHLLIKAIEDQYSTIKFSDDFFDLTNGPETYKNMYMLCQRKEGRVFEDMGTGLLQVTGFPTQQSQTVIVADAAVYVQNLQVDQLVTGVWTISTQQAYPTFTARIKEGSDVIMTKTFQGGTNTSGSISQHLNNSSEGYTLEIETSTAFDITSLQVQTTDPSGNQVISQITGTNASPAFEVKIEKQFVVQNHLPNLKIIDFLTGLFKMFNLTAYEKDGIIHVKTLESFYNGGTVRDVTDYVDPSTTQVDKALPYQEVKFGYEDTDTKIAKQHTQLSKTAWGGLEYQGTGGLDSNNETFDITTPFAHLKLERLINGNSASAVSDTDIQWGWMANENNEPYFENAVVFLGIYSQSAQTARFLESTDSTAGIVDINNFWIPSNSVALDAATNKESINFGLEINEWTRGILFTETLFEKYYRFYIASLFNKTKRLTKIRARLPKKFILNYTLADILKINDERYKINSITTNLLTGESQLELLNETTDLATSAPIEGGGSDAGQIGPSTNVLIIEDCANLGTYYESSLTLADLNLANNKRVEDSSQNTYKVTGNTTPNTYTQKVVTSTGLDGCPSAIIPPVTYYRLRKCSDGTETYRTSTETGNPTYANSQQVFDGGTKYIVISSQATEADGYTSVTITSTPSNPTQFSCAGNTTTYYYSLTPCCGGTVLYAHGASSGVTGTKTYNNVCYTIAASGTVTAPIDIDNDMGGTCACPTYYYTLNDCSNSSTIVHYAHSKCSNLASTELSYNSTCYIVVQTTNTTATVDLDALSSCSCGGSGPAIEYYRLRNCATAALGPRTSQTTTDIALTTDVNPANADRVEDANGNCYTANNTTTDTTITNLAVTKLNVTGCPNTPCTQTLYYNLQQCSTGNTGYISAQTINQISLSVNDIVASGSSNGPRYKVLGSTGSGSTVGTVFTTSDTACPEYYTLTQCYTNSTGYRTGNTTADITLSNGDRVQDPSGMPYTVTGTVSSGLADVGTVTDTGQTGCPSISGANYYSLQRCSDSVTGFLSLQTTADITIATNDTVTIAGGTRYQVVGQATISGGTQVGVVTPDGQNNCLTPVTPPVQPPATTYYATFVTCDDPSGAILQVYSLQAIGTWWVLKDGTGTGWTCYRWLNNNQAANPVDISNYTIYSSESTAGANCLDCEAAAPSPPPVSPPPSGPTCHTLQLYKSGVSAVSLCTETTTRDVYTNNSTLASSTAIYLTDSCSSLLATDHWFSDDGGSTYYFWNASLSTLTGPYTNNCP